MYCAIGGASSQAPGSNHTLVRCVVRTPALIISPLTPHAMSMSAVDEDPAPDVDGGSVVILCA